MELNAENLSAFSAICSAAASLAAFVFTVVIYRQTRKTTRPTERPIIISQRPMVDRKITDESALKVANANDVVVELELKFKNIGQHPAQDVAYWVGWVEDQNDPSHFSRVTELHPVNQLAPQEHKSIPVKLHKKDFEPIGEDKKFLFFTNISYRDKYNYKACHQEEYWFVYLSESGDAGDAIYDDILKFQTYARKIHNETTENPCVSEPKSFLDRLKEFLPFTRNSSL